MEPLPSSPEDNEAASSSGIRPLTSSDDDDDDCSSRPPPNKRHAASAPLETLATSTARLLADGALMYGATLVCVAPGLLISSFPLEFDEACSRLRELLDGTLRRNHVRARPWTSHEETLPGVLRVCDAMLAAPSGLAVADALNHFHKEGWPPAPENQLIKRLIEKMARAAPIMVMSTGAAQQQLGPRLEDGESFLVPRPIELQPAVAMWTMLGAHQAAVLDKQLARVSSLPLEKLEAMLPSTQAKAVLIAAVAHITGNRALARSHPISCGRIELAASRVSSALARLPQITEELATTIATERGAALRRASELFDELSRAKQLGQTERVVRELETGLAAAARKAALRDPEHTDYPAFFKRRWREEARKLPELQHMPRGHARAIHVEYPDFKRAVEATVHELGGRAASDRQSAKVYLGRSKWGLVAELLQDEEHMRKLGCTTIPASVGVLRKHRRRAERSLQPKITDEAGQLNVSCRRVIKLLLPTEEEQPNGHQLNLAIKELEQFGMMNADLIDLNNRDDKANWQLDNLYRKKQMLQETWQATEGKRLRFREENGAFDSQAYDRAMKAETHDHIKATGYRIVITTNAQMDAGAAATHLLSGLSPSSSRDNVAAAMSQIIHPKTLLARASQGDGGGDGDSDEAEGGSSSSGGGSGGDSSGSGSFFCFDPRQQVGRDARVWATVRCLKPDPSTPFEHTRNMLWHIEHHRNVHVIPGTDILKPFFMLIVDGGGDENPRFVQQIMCLTLLFLRRGAEYLVAATAAAGFTPYRLVEFAQGCFSDQLDGVRIDSDTFGLPQLEKDGKPKNPAEAQLEERNLRHACKEMREYLDGSEAFGFPVAAFVPPKPTDLSAFAQIDETALKDYRDDAGGCGCKTGCCGARCRSCYTQGRPCTWRCKCTGCTNPIRFPTPAKVSPTELQTLPLQEIIARLTPRDVEYFASQHGRFAHYGTMIKLCDPAVASSCWYCSRFGTRLLPLELQQHFLPLYPTVGDNGEFTRFAKRWEETCAGRGQAYTSDASLVSRVITAAYAKQATAAEKAAAAAEAAKAKAARAKAASERAAALAARAAAAAAAPAAGGVAATAAEAAAAATAAATTASETAAAERSAKEKAAAVQKAVAEPPEALVASLAKETLLQPASIRSLFKKHAAHAQKTTRWEVPHRSSEGGGASDDTRAAAVDNAALTYDASLVGRRCTALWSPPDGEAGDEGYYAATVVAFNGRCAAHKGRFLLHFDDGQRERVQLPDDTVRIMTACVSVCRCKRSPGGAVGCCEGADGSEKLPRPWEADPK